MTTSTILAIVFGILALLFLMFAVVMFINLRWTYAKLTYRHMSIAMLLVAALSKNAKVMKQLGGLKAADVPEYLEDLRDTIKASNETRAALPDDSRSDGEFILYLTLRGLLSGVDREDLVPVVSESLRLSASVRRVLARRGG